MLATLRAAGFASVRSFVEPVEEAGVDIGNIVFIASVEGEEVRREEEREIERRRDGERAEYKLNLTQRPRASSLRSRVGRRRQSQAQPTGISRRPPREGSTAWPTTTLETARKAAVAVALNKAT